MPRDAPPPRPLAERLREMLPCVTDPRLRAWIASLITDEQRPDLMPQQRKTEPTPDPKT